VSSRDFHRVAGNQELDTVEVSAASETKEEPERWEHRPLGIVLPPPLEKKNFG
jgi:hypothetical protein